ncbi:uncharacterized protein LOC129722493 [Wyeomyia smithii]|uniref:uncharacterized protein LOC129722493 n=1 Tax=Wyeomyia smithii TaxID=174621 RepID=UPI0024681DBC|nr:uncharacterized protein LOC129722493 [Wyeomyia smithii]
MLPEALQKRLAKRGIIQGDSGATPAVQQAHHPPPPSRQQQHSESSSQSDSDSQDERRDADLNNEEIIAEDYDEYDQINPEAFEYPIQKRKINPALDWSEKMKQKMVKRYGFQSVDGCQNKYNIHHHCTMYCVQRYGEVEFEIEKEYEKRAKRLLERYPLPRHWRKEYDIGCKAFYFYNKETRIVSWLPPTHPDAKMTKSAKVLRKELMEITKNQENANDAIPKAVIVESYPPLPKPSSREQGMVGPVGETLKPPIVNPPKRPHLKHPSRDDEKRPRVAGANRIERDRERDRDRDRERDRDRDRDRRDRRGDDRRDERRERDRDRERGEGRGGRSGKQSGNSGALDPMDPAAYSDIPRGTWASGLDAAAGKKEKEKKPEKRKAPREDESGDEHEVLKVAAISEFTQEDDKDE